MILGGTVVLDVFVKMCQLGEMTGSVRHVYE